MLSLLIALEQKFGRLAIPGLLRIIITLQAVVWLLIHLGPGGVGVLTSLAFMPPDVLGLTNEWWRLLTFMLIPGDLGLLWLLMAVPFTWMVSDGLENAWGSFRVNLYLLACVTCLVLEGCVHRSFDLSSTYILTSTLMAYAIYYPDQTISLYGIIPLRMIWVGWIFSGYLAFDFLGHPDQRWHIAASLVPFIVVFGPAMSRLLHRNVKTLERRQRFAAGQMNAGDSLHRCARCGKTEKDHPGLDFRVNAQGEDICSDCRAAKQPSHL